MNEVPGINIINKFADSLGMPVVNLNIYKMTFVSLCLCSRKLVTGSRDNNVRERTSFLTRPLELAVTFYIKVLWTRIPNTVL